MNKKATATLNIKASHTKLITDEKEAKELNLLMDKICINPECKKYYRHDKNQILRTYGKFKEFLGI